MTMNNLRPNLQHRSSLSSVQSLNDTGRRSQGRSQSLVLPVDNSRRPSSPVISSVPRLSIADRFMSSSGYQHSPLTSSPLSNPIVTESINDITISNPDHATQHVVDKSPNPARLTIADAFMKSSSSLISSYSSSSIKQKETTTGTIHPLDNQSVHSIDINLELSPPSASPSLYHHYSRPFGSQDTLVSAELLSKHQEEKENTYYQVSLDEYYHPKQQQADQDERNSDFSSTTRLGEEENDLDLQQHKKPTKPPYEEERHAGVWIGCCFLSCGPPSQRRCGRRWRVFGIFLTTLLLIVMSSIFWPRTPLIRIEGASLLAPAKLTTTNQGAMVGNVQFESQWMVNFTVDNRQNWVLPTRLVQLHVIVKDVLTGNVIGKGLQNDHPESLVLDPRVISTVQLGISLDYQARDISDTTFASLKKACVPDFVRRDLLVARAEDTSLKDHTGGNATLPTNHTAPAPPPAPPIAPPPAFPPTPKEHESLSLLFWMTLHIWGLDFFGYRPTVLVTTATGGFVCPLA